MRKKALTTLALTAAAIASAAGSSSAAPVPTGPQALGKLTGLILPGPDQVTGSNVDTGSPLAELQDVNAVNLMSDHSRTQTTGTSGNQG